MVYTVCFLKIYIIIYYLISYQERSELPCDKTVVLIFSVSLKIPIFHQTADSYQTRHMPRHFLILTGRMQLSLSQGSSYVKLMYWNIRALMVLKVTSEVIKHFSCSPHRSMKFQLFIKTTMLKNNFSCFQTI